LEKRGGKRKARRESQSRGHLYYEEKESNVKKESSSQDGMERREPRNYKKGLVNQERGGEEGAMEGTDDEKEPDDEKVNGQRIKSHQSLSAE